MGAKKFGMSSKPREIKLFGGISRDFAGISRNCPKSLRIKSLFSFFSGSEKGVFWKRGLFRKIHFLEKLEILEILENPQTVENKGE